MTHRTIRSIIGEQDAVTAPAATTVIDAARLMRERRVGAVLVVEEDRLAGVFTERDALFRVIAEGLDVATTRLADVMTRKPRTIHPDKPFAEALHLMYEGGFRHVPVVEDGRPVGMISARDALGPELEDFVYELLRRNQADDILA
ncbi:MAG TPA: CBS domain-containing protein [Burkholderiales bacterium]|jgi:CBS domain-containing protein|nr:CBS domain-containing protein [Burkholderiales bacterium]